DGVVVIAHGRSDTTAMKNAVKLAHRFAAAGLPARLAASLGAFAATGSPGSPGPTGTTPPPPPGGGTGA
ncbi:MAG: hypothetical protein HS111_38730, partial [Kofleriaceae bacterium]|nr:hypothetical protein [Kofleriaceae bacterium]